MRCYGACFKQSEAYYVKYELNVKGGRFAFGVTAEWRALREKSLGANEGRKVRKIMERLSRLWIANNQQGPEYTSLVLVHEKLTQSFMLSKAVDFIVHFSCIWLPLVYGNTDKPQNVGQID